MLTGNYGVCHGLGVRTCAVHVLGQYYKDDTDILQLVIEKLEEHNLINSNQPQ